MFLMTRLQAPHERLAPTDQRRCAFEALAYGTMLSTSAFGRPSNPAPCASDGTRGSAMATALAAFFGQGGKSRNHTIREASITS